MILLVIHVLEGRCVSKIHNTADTFHEALHIDVSPKCGTKKLVCYVCFRMAVPISLSLHTVNESSKNILRTPTDALKNVSPFSMPSFITNVVEIDIVHILTCL